MREILFRGKTRTGKWVYGSLIQAERFCCILESEDDVHPMDYPYLDGELGVIDGSVTPVIPETIGQYTGLTDKNGKKIFEGDICIDRGGNIHLVKYAEFTPKNFYRMFGCESSLVLYGVHTLSDAIECIIPAKHTLEVIGNIHDNPELLKGGGEE